MKPTDELINQALQKALQQRFDSFEVQPSGRLSTEVLSAIRRLNSPRYRRFALLASLIFICSLGVQKATFRPDDSFKGKSASVQAQLTRGTPPAVTQAGATTKITRGPSSGEATLLKPYPNAEQIVHLPDVVTKKHSTAAPNSRPTFQRPALGIPLPSLAPDVRIQADDPTADAQIHESAPPPPRRDLQKLQRRPLRLSTLSPSTPSPGSLAQSATASVPPRAPSSPWRGVVSFTPTNTYQRLTVLPQDHIRYQNFELPSLFSVRTAGFDLRGGIERKGFQILIEYSRFTQKLTYEVALDQYLVQPNSANSYTIVQKGAIQAEEITFQLVGLSLQKKFFLPTALPGYHLSTGVTLSHDLTASQNLAWGTLGIGKSWPVSPAASLSLIPQVGFGLNSVRTNNDAFKNRFYQFGVTLELTFGKN